MPIVILIPFVVLGGILMYGFVLFSQLLRAEYLQYPEIWKADGCPLFMNLPVPGYRWIMSPLAAQWLMFIWLSRTPIWIEESPVLRTQLRRYRWCILIWNVGFLICLVVVVVTFVIYPDMLPR